MGAIITDQNGITQLALTAGDTKAGVSNQAFIQQALNYGGFIQIQEAGAYEIVSDSFVKQSNTTLQVAPGTTFTINGSTVYPKTLSSVLNTIIIPDENLYVLPAPGVGMTNTTEVICAQYLIPAGKLTDGDTIEIRGTITKSGSVENATLRVRMGTAGTTSDTLIISGTCAAGTSQSWGGIIEMRRDSKTSILKLGNNTIGGYNGGGSAAAGQTNVTISDMDANAIYVSVSLLSSAAAETITLNDCRIRRRRFS